MQTRNTPKILNTEYYKKKLLNTLKILQTVKAEYFQNMEYSGILLT